MLTAKQNMIECMKGSKGNPDRFVNQYEAIQLLFHPFLLANPLLADLVPYIRGIFPAFGKP